MKTEITRRTLMKSTLLAAGVLGNPVLSETFNGHVRNDETKRPNVVLICADMASAKHFGCYGDPGKVTPNIDQLAQSGVRFEQAYCATTPCIPARASMMTGLYAHTHGKTSHVKMPLNPCPPLLPEIMSRNGYRTGIVGKTHWWPAADSLGADEVYLTIDTHLIPELGKNDAWLQSLAERNIVEEYDKSRWKGILRKLNVNTLPTDCLKVNWTGDKTCSLIDKFSKEDKPFFLKCSFVEPHGSGNAPQSRINKFKDLPMRPVIGRPDEAANKPEVQQHLRARRPDVDGYRRAVYAALNMVDDNVGKILDKLESLDLKRNTYVIFMTDHGDLMGDHGLFEKTFLYDSAVKIPFIVSGPGIGQQQTRSHLVSQVDLLPTVLGLTNIKESGLRLEGRDVCPIIEDQQHPWRTTLFCESDQTVHLKKPWVSQSKMLRTGPWKYIYTLVAGHKLEEELYHLDKDPDELFNLAQDDGQKDRVVQFRTEVLRWLTATEPSRLHPVPENHYRFPAIEEKYI